MDDLKVWFGGVHALDGVTLRIDEGRLYGLIGPNGSGKTTLVNALSGLVPLTGGIIRYLGNDVTGWSAHERARAGMARTFQTIRLIPSLTVRENVMLGADEAALSRTRGWSPSRRNQRVREVRIAADRAIALLDIGSASGKLPGGLSYGLQRRVEIARAVAGKPKILFLDEPVAGMNRSERLEIADILRRLQGEGLTQVLIEHDLRMILGLCDYAFVMNFGKCLAEGRPRETADLAVVREAYLGRSHVRA
jgi:ABC-type branched-subunit amino acid transport system ATPase component